MEKTETISALTNGIQDENIDLIALQEVNQYKNDKIIDDKIYNYYPCIKNVVKDSNYVLKLNNKLKKEYYWTWLPIKKSYNKFDEGLAFLSKKKIEDINYILLSKTNDYNNWKKRMALGIKIEGVWFYNVHFGWYDDEEEPFELQWNVLNKHLNNIEKAFLMGDFNNPSNVKNEGYDLVTNSGWYDTFMLTNIKDEGYTVIKEIDGWKNQTNKMRIDYIFCNKKIEVKNSFTIFNGFNYQFVSDHNGVLITI